MNRPDTIKALEEVAQEIDAIADEHTKTTQKKLLNLIEALLKDNEELRTENQKLRDEINRLNGEQGKPDIRKQTGKDISSEAERSKNKKPRSGKNKNKKKNRIKINHVEICRIDKEQLPDDAVFKGYKSSVVQDLIIETNNIEFKKAIYYSPSQNKTFVAPLPQGYSGEFGPNIRKLIISLNTEHGMTESSIADFLENNNILIGAGTISRLLTQSQDVNEFYQESKDIVTAGLQSADYQQMDDTGARVKGKNYYDHILCNEFYTAYFTRQNKDRLTIIDILTQGEMKFAFNEYAFSLMQEMKLPEKWLAAINEHAGKTVNREELDIILNAIFPDLNKQHTNRQILLESTAIAAYQSLIHATKILLTDDAPQYNKITAFHALCWIHIGRHFKKLMPVVKSHRIELNEFITKFWDYYHQLLSFKESPTALEAERLSKEFDLLFSTETTYDQLNDRIAKTNAKKQQLLLVLEFPFLPLHNNDSELGARSQARRRDISFHTMSQKGTRAKDAFMTVRQTAKKLGVRFYDYIGDRINKTYQMPSLADLITERSQKTVLNTS